MKIRRYVFCLLVAVFFSFTANAYSYSPPSTSPSTIHDAISEANKFIGYPYFQLRNINVETSKTANQLTWQKRGLIVYGFPWGEFKDGENRYLGYTYKDDDYTNIKFQHDAWAGGYLEDRKWLEKPWENPTYRSTFNISRNEFNNREIYLSQIYQGIKEFYGDAVRGDHIQWQKYVHVLQPPTYFSDGMGRMWHQTPSGGIWYITVPIKRSEPLMPNLYVKSLDPGIPIETNEAGENVYKAQVGKTYKATVVFGIESLQNSVDLNKYTPYLGGIHVVNGYNYKANLEKLSGKGSISEPIDNYPYKTDEGKSQTVTFDAQNSQIVATFKWTPQINTQKLVAAINDGFFVPKRFPFEGLKGDQFEDNVVYCDNIEVEPPPDLYVAKLDPGTKYKKAGEKYQGKVSFGLRPGYKEKVTAQITLQHNGYNVPGVHGQTLVFDPADPSSLVQEFDFQFTGMPNHINSELYAKITPTAPTSVDLNPSDNDKKVIVKSQNIDIAVTDIVQTTPIYTDTTESAYAIFKNNGDNTETFAAKFYADGKAIKTINVTIPAKGEIKKYFQWRAPSTPKTVHLKVEADPEKKLDDQNRNNNTRIESFAVVAPANAPLYCRGNDTAVWQYNWKEQYQRTVKDEKGEEKTEYAYVNYSEDITAEVIIYTKQGPPDLNNFPTPPEPRESRGKWEIEGWAAKNGLNPNEVTRAGYGFEVKVITTYTTDYENPPLGFSYNNRPIIDLSTLRLEFFDTRGRSVVNTADHTIHMECTDTQRYTRNGIRYTVQTWELPLKTIRFSDGSSAQERKHYVDLKTPDGKYELVLSSLGQIGINDKLKVCEDSYFVTIHGNMYDDIYTRPKVD